jgi:hypothetical protein
MIWAAQSWFVTLKDIFLHPIKSRFHFTFYTLSFYGIAPCLHSRLNEIYTNTKRIFISITFKFSIERRVKVNRTENWFFHFSFSFLFEKHHTWQGLCRVHNRKVFWSHFAHFCNIMRCKPICFTSIMLREHYKCD